MNFFIIQNSVLGNKFSCVFILFYNNLEIDFQNYLVTLHSIDVTVQDTKRINGLSSAITEKIDYNLYLWTPFCYSRWPP